ncbi:Exosome complex component rrp42 [Sporothrix epigloea]|uniref:Ribosomal RNA-processing protein 42 n=1 Tax=Sporothrix epigloea TaxID=1892477 RepID=A0ABP0DIB5_9PEZI
MATTQHVLLSPAELAFLHTSLAQHPPIRPDGRTPAQFRPLRAETGMLPSANGSARICFADGSEAIVGVKAQVERTRRGDGGGGDGDEDEDEDNERDQDGNAGGLWEEASDDDGGDGGGDGTKGGSGKNGNGGSGAASNASPSWVEVTVEIPSLRDDDASTVFLGALLAEALLADGGLTRALRINRRFHWKLFLDVLLISPPLSYPLPLLSLTTHLALLATRLPRLVSEGDEDPFFDDDWDASTFLYPRSTSPSSSLEARPPITLLVMTVGDNILFDPTAEELAVANAVLAISVGRGASSSSPSPNASTASPLRLLAIRTIDPPSHLTAPGTPYIDAVQPKAAATPNPQNTGLTPTAPARVVTETEDVYGVWKAPRGGAKVALLAAMTHKVLEKGGVADEVFAGLDGVEIV